MSYFCRQNVSQISLEIVANYSHPSEILALVIFILINLKVLSLIYFTLYFVIFDLNIMFKSDIQEYVITKELDINMMPFAG